MASVGQFSHPFSKQCKSFLRVIMASRVIKDLYRERLRDTMERLKVPLEQPYLEEVSSFLNLIFGNSAESEGYWQNTVKTSLLSKFGAIGFTEAELAQTTLFKKIILKETVGSKTSAILLLFTKVKELTGFKLIKDLQNDIKKNDHDIFVLKDPFEELSIKDLGERIKHTNIVSQAQGFYYLLKGLGLKSVPEAALPLFRRSCATFEHLLAYDPSNSFGLRHFAEALSQIAFGNGASSAHNINDPHLVKALSLFHQSTEIDPNDKIAYLLWGKTLTIMGNLDSAEDMFLKSLEIDPNYASTLERYAQLLNRKDLRDQAALCRKRMKLILTGGH